MHILILVIMWSVIGMAWNLLGGYCGQVSFGHAAFFGVGAYIGGHYLLQIRNIRMVGPAVKHCRGNLPSHSP